MTTVQDVLAVAAQLSPVEQLEIIQALSRGLQKRNTTSDATPSHQRRIPGLDAGPVWMSDDFDAELPDTFCATERYSQRAPRAQQSRPGR